MKEVSIVIPVKNEEDGLRFLFEDLSNSNLQDKYRTKLIFVIDSSSIDGSIGIAKMFGGIILLQEDNTGKGFAIQLAIERESMKGSDYIVFLDADGSYSFECVGRTISALEEGADIVSGSRFLDKKGKPKGMSGLHFFGNKALSMTSSLRNRRKITDVCTGLWGFTSAALNSIDIRSKGFDLEAELAGVPRKTGLKHIEIPVKWTQRKGGVSKLRSLKDGLMILIRIIKR
jgi:glycosyltransferase involved in cell wall biosynthesis